LTVPILKNKNQPHSLPFDPIQVLLSGVYPTHATSDEAAADLFQASSVDLIILDVGPPGISGFDGLEALRGQEDQTPVIFLTAKDLVDTTLASFDGGADAFLPRPFSF
jgi:DNA-binding response OmpR family regulator